jgi:uncharacterized protein with PhoU and TrkA domain
MLKPFTDRDFTAHVNQQAKFGQFWDRLKTEMESKNKFGSQVTELERKIGNLEADVVHHQALAATAVLEAAEILDEATDRAGEIVKAAQSKDDKADAALTKAEMVVESAHAEAREIVSAAEAEAKRVTALITELRGLAQ